MKWFGWRQWRRVQRALPIFALTMATGLHAGTGSIFDDSQLWPATAPTTPPARPTPATPTPGPAPNRVPEYKPSVAPPALIPLAPAPPGKLLPPELATRMRILQSVKQIYEKEYAERSAVAKRQLANELLAEADKIQSNFAARFVLLQEAKTAAAGAGDTDACRTAIDDLDKTFTISKAALIAEAISRLAETDADDAGGVLTWAVEAIDHEISTDDYPGARQIVKSASGILARSKDTFFFKPRIKQFESLLAEHDHLRPALEKLKTVPADPVANLAAGKFFCFWKQDWGTGLPMLAKGSDAKLKALAQSDLLNPAGAGPQFQLANNWWEAAHESPSVVVQEALHARAHHWYKRSLPGMSGIDKLLADKRLTESLAKSPNLLKQMTLHDDGAAQPDGTIRLFKHGVLKTPQEIAVPFRADVVAKTDSTNLRLGFAHGRIIFNWETNKTQLRHHSPIDDKLEAFDGKGLIPVNQYVHVTWIIEPDSSKVFVDGELRGEVIHNFTNVHGPFSVYPSEGSVVTIRSVTITPLSNDPKTN